MQKCAKWQEEIYLVTIMYSIFAVCKVALRSESCSFFLSLSLSPSLSLSLFFPVFTALLFMFFVSREIFPYLVVVIGLENVLVLTKSVVSTPVDLEVKLRIAQGECV